MTWAEFELCQIAHKRQIEREQRLFREVAYQVHCLNYLFDKKKPPSKKRFWPIDKPKAKTKEEESLIKAAIIRAEEEYKAAVNG